MNEKFKLAAAALAGIVATVAAGSIAVASMGHGMGPIGNADLDNNGEITRAEWVQKAGQGFDAMDVNKDGKLVVGEIPAPRHHGGRHGGPRGGPGGPGGWDRGGPDGPDGPDGWDDQAPPPPAATAPATAPAQPAPAPTTTPQPAK